MLIKLVVKIYSLKLVSVYQGYTLIVFMTQGYLTAERLRTTGLIASKTVECQWRVKYVLAGHYKPKRGGD